MPEKDLIQRFNTHARMTLVSRSWDLKDEKLGHFLRKNGISSSELYSWRAQMKDGLEDGKPICRSVQKNLELKVLLLERELHEAKLLLEIQKKVQSAVDLENVVENTPPLLDPKS